MFGSILRLFNVFYFQYSVPPVLGVLQMMAKETDLKAQAIYLMLQLWKRQTRCFPYLHTLLSENTKSFTFDSGVNEILIAQASSILEICSIEYDICVTYFLCLV